jgi:hypothetical protein
MRREHIKHFEQTSEKTSNMPIKHFQHAFETLAIYSTSSIYFCNTYVKQLKHTSETSETHETYACNTRMGRGVVAHGTVGDERTVGEGA